MAQNHNSTVDERATVPLAAQDGAGASAERLGTDTILRASSDGSARQKRALDWRRHDLAVRVLPEHRSSRIADCRQYATMTALELGHGAVMMRAGDGVCRWAHVCRCKNSWLCAVCMRYDSGERRRLLQSCVDEWVGRGGGHMLVTFTAPHSLEDDGRELVTRFLLAQERLCRSGGYVRLLKRLGVEHQVKNLEYTWGPKNGAHPHRHALYFLTKPAHWDAGQLAAARELLYKDPRYKRKHIDAMEPMDLLRLALGVELSRLWWAACCAELVGDDGRAYPPLLRPYDMAQARTFGLRAVDVQVGYGDVQEYIDKYGEEPKWSLASELTSGRTKRGGRAARAGVRFTPLQLLDAMDDEGCPVSPDELAYQFCRYAEAMRDRNPLQGLGRLCTALGIDDSDRHDQAAEGEAVELVTTVPETVAIRRGGAWRPLLLLAEGRGLPAVRERLDQLVREHIDQSSVYRCVDGSWRYIGGSVAGALPARGDPSLELDYAPLPEPDDDLEASLSWFAPEIAAAADPYLAALQAGRLDVAAALF